MTQCFMASKSNTHAIFSGQALKQSKMEPAKRKNQSIWDVK